MNVGKTDKNNAIEQLLMDGWDFVATALEKTDIAKTDGVGDSAYIAPKEVRQRKEPDVSQGDLIWIAAVFLARHLTGQLLHWRQNSGLLGKLADRIITAGYISEQNVGNSVHEMAITETSARAFLRDKAVSSNDVRGRRSLERLIALAGLDGKTTSEQGKVGDDVLRELDRMIANVAVSSVVSETQGIATKALERIPHDSDDDTKNSRAEAIVTYLFDDAKTRRPDRLQGYQAVSVMRNIAINGNGHIAQQALIQLERIATGECVRLGDRLKTLGETQTPFFAATAALSEVATGTNVQEVRDSAISRLKGLAYQHRLSERVYTNLVGLAVVDPQNVPNILEILAIRLDGLRSLDGLLNIKKPDGTPHEAAYGAFGKICRLAKEPTPVGNEARNILFRMLQPNSSGVAWRDEAVAVLGPIAASEGKVGKLTREAMNNPETAGAAQAEPRFIAVAWMNVIRFSSDLAIADMAIDQVLKLNAAQVGDDRSVTMETVLRANQIYQDKADRLAEKITYYLRNDGYAPKAQTKAIVDLAAALAVQDTQVSNHLLGKARHVERLHPLSLIPDFWQAVALGGPHKVGIASKKVMGVRALVDISVHRSTSAVSLLGILAKEGDDEISKKAIEALGEIASVAKDVAYDALEELEKLFKESRWESPVKARAFDQFSRIAREQDGYLAERAIQRIMEASELASFEESSREAVSGIFRSSGGTKGLFLLTRSLGIIGRGLELFFDIKARAEKGDVVAIAVTRMLANAFAGNGSSADALYTPPSESEVIRALLKQAGLKFAGEGEVKLRDTGSLVGQGMEQVFFPAENFAKLSVDDMNGRLRKVRTSAEAVIRVMKLPEKAGKRF